MRYGICIPVCTLYVSWTWIICQTDVIYAYMHVCTYMCCFLLPLLLPFIPSGSPSSPLPLPLLSHLLSSPASSPLPLSPLSFFLPSPSSPLSLFLPSSSSSLASPTSSHRVDAYLYIYYICIIQSCIPPLDISPPVHHLYVYHACSTLCCRG